MDMCGLMDIYIYIYVCVDGYIYIWICVCRWIYRHILMSKLYSTCTIRICI